MTNYVKGRRLEYTVRKRLEDHGWFVMRSAGSKGPFDLIALKPHAPLRCIQVKTRKASQADLMLLRSMYARLPENGQVELWSIEDKEVKVAVVERPTARQAGSDAPESVIHD